MLLSQAEVCWLVSELASETLARFCFSLRESTEDTGGRNYSVIAAIVFHLACLSIELG